MPFQLWKSYLPLDYIFSFIPALIGQHEGDAEKFSTQSTFQNLTQFFNRVFRVESLIYKLKYWIFNCMIFLIMSNFKFDNIFWHLYHCYDKNLIYVLNRIRRGTDWVKINSYKRKYTITKNCSHIKPISSSFSESLLDWNYP